MNYNYIYDQRVSSSTDPSSSTGEPQNPPEEASNENQRARRRRRSPSPRRDYSRHSRSPRDRSRTPSRDSRHNRRNHSRRSPSPRGRNSRRSSSPQDNYSRRSPRDLWRDNYIERNEDYLREEDYRRDAGYQLHNDYPQQDNYYQRGEDYRLDGYQDRMNQATQIVKFDHAIPESCVGLVIGRNGTEIQSISQKSQCKVQVNAEQNMSGYRMVEIFGQPENIERAKVLIDELVQRAALRHPAPMNYPVPQNPQPQVDHESKQKITIDIPIPPHKCGSIIGKGGETMRKLRSWSNCHIQLIQENNIADSMKPLRITGDAKSVEQAQRLVNDILTGVEGNEAPAAALMCANGPVATMSLQIKVPRVTVGAIMGLQGKNIKRLSDETGTKIQFMSDDDPKLMERTLSIIGHKSKVQVAAQLIRAIVETNNESSHAPVSLFYLSIPSSKCGLVIGRGGETIKQINIESGAHCELTREGNEDPNEKTFVIRGTDYQVEHAKHLIGIKVGDIPPNTPFAYANQLQHPMPTQYPMQSQPQMQQQNPMQQAYQQQQMQQKQQPTNVQMWAGQPIIQQAPLQPPHQTQQQQSLINPAYPGPTYPPQPNFAAQQNFAPTGNFQAQQVIQPSSIAAWHQLQQQKQMMQQQQLQQQQIQQQQLQQHQMQQQQLQQQQLLQLQGQQQYGRFDQSSLLTLAGPQLLPQAHQMVQQPQTQSAVHAAAAPAQSPVKSPAAPAEQGLSLYAQYALQVAAESKAKKEAAEKAAASQKAAAAPKATENQSEAKEEGAQDFSEQWYQYYISIGDHGAAEAVRKRIEQLKAEKEKKNAASSSRNGEF